MKRVPLTPFRRVQKIPILDHTVVPISTRALHSSPSSTRCRLQKDAFAVHGRPPISGSQLTGSAFSRMCWQRELSLSALKSQKHMAYIAFGSNVGDRSRYIDHALKKLNSREDVWVRRTSSLWETKAMYVQQANFFNGVCEITTSLEPLPLLDLLQDIENEIGRVKIIDKGPRSIDLDILLFDDVVMQHERLTIPHALMLEREFVLRPLSESVQCSQHNRRVADPDSRLVPHATIPNPTGTSSGDVLYHLAQLPRSNVPAYTVTALSSALTISPRLTTKNTSVMAILNLTPDSFSDGGLHPSTSTQGDTSASTIDVLERLSSAISGFVSSGARIIDVGGQSTRPNAAPVTSAEEISRVVPIIRHLTDSMQTPEWDGEHFPKPLISIDTYRADVARAAVQAGAHIVNDVSGGTLDAAMFDTVAELGCSYVLMHMRGDPSNMHRPPHVLYPDGLIETIGRELRHSLDKALDAGIPRWRVILDPGIGFAKGGHQNCTILRRLEDLRNFPGLENFAWMVGSSRKGFIARAAALFDDDCLEKSVQMQKRVWGTAATVAAAVQGGADIVRVHDVEPMVRVVKMSHAIWRS